MRRWPRPTLPHARPVDIGPSRLSRLLLVHLGWSAVVLAGVGLIVLREGTTPCPPGGLLALDCGSGQRVVLAVASLAAVLYVALLSAVVAWSRVLARRPHPDPTGGRDWYVVAALVGVPIAPLLAFTVLAGLGWLG